MELSKKSWHYKLHHITWGQYARDPNNLCPYFWKTIVFGSLLLLIAGPLCIVFWAVGKVANKLQENAWPDIMELGLASPYLFMAIIFDCFLWVILCMIYMWFVPLGTQGVVPIGIVGWFITIFLLVRWAVIAWISRRRRRGSYTVDGTESEETQESTPNPIIEYIKTWYKKHCPIIKWKD